MKKRTRLISFATMAILGILGIFTATYYAAEHFGTSFGWTNSGKPTITVSNSSLVNSIRNSSLGINTRIKNSKSFTFRMAKMANFTWRQNQVYDPSFSSTYVRFWTNYTYVTAAESGYVDGYTAWYDTNYGLALDYLGPYANTSDDVEPPSEDTASTNIENDMIAYSDFLFPGNRATAFVTSANAVALSDAKSAALFQKVNTNFNYPIYVSGANASSVANSLTITSNLTNKLKAKGVKNVILLGGYSRFNFTAGFDSGFNIIRAGGLNTQETYNYLRTLHSNILTPPSYTPDSEGIVISGTLPNTSTAYRTEVYNKLVQYRDTGNTAYLESLVSSMSSTYNIGSDPVAGTTQAKQLVLGVHTPNMESYWVCYYNNVKGWYIYSYILPNYFAKTQPTLSTSLSLNTYDYKASATQYWIKKGNKFEVTTSGSMSKSTGDYPDSSHLILAKGGVNDSNSTVSTGYVKSNPTFTGSRATAELKAINTTLKATNSSGTTNGISFKHSYYGLKSGDNYTLYSDTGYVYNGSYIFAGRKSSGINLGVDGTAPTLSGTSSYGWSNTNITVAKSATDSESGVKNLRILDSNSTLLSTQTGSSLSKVISTEGTNTFYVKALDNVGNESSSTITTKIDKTNPSGVFTVNSHTWRNTNLVVSFNPSDALSGVKQWRYRHSSDNGATYGTWSAYVSGDTTSNITVSANGNNKIQAEVTDNAGNTATVTSGVYQIDKTNPSGVFTPNSHTWRNTDLTVSFNPSDSDSGVKQWRYKKSSDNGVTYGAWSAYIVGDTTSNITVSAEGLNKIQVEVTDKVGNSATVTSGIYQMDKTLPSGVFTFNSHTWRNTNLTVSFNPSDDRSGVKQWRYRQSSDGTTYGAWSAYVSGDTTSNITVSSEGLNRIQAEVTDKAGNIATVTSGEYQLDKTNPSGVFTFNSHTWRNTNLTVSFNPSDDRSGVKQWRYRQSSDGITYGAWSSYVTGDTTSNITVSAEGLNRIQAEVTDKAGNIATLTSGEYQLDKTNPSGVFTPNSHTWMNTNLTVSFNPSDDRSGVKQWRYRQSSDGTTYGAWSAYITGDTTSNITVSAEGLNKIQAEVTDKAGNISTITSGIYQMDKTKPGGVFTPNSQTWINTNLTVTFNPSDDRSGVKQWRYKQSSDNGVTYGAWSAYITGDTNSNITISTEGLNKIQVEITDTVGNTATLTSGVYQIDKTLPSGVFTANSANWGNANITVTFNPSDDRGGVKQWRYRTSPDGVTYGTWSSYITGDTNSNIVVSDEGKNRIQAEVTDKAGNIKVITSGVYQIDKTKPSGVFTPNSSTWGKSNITVTFNPSDDSSGVKQWRYRQSPDGTTYGAWSEYIVGDVNSTILVSDEGTNKIQAEVTDKAGNIVTVTSGVYQIDKTKPSGVFTANSATWRNTNITVTFNPSDDRSGVKQWRYRHSSDGTTYGAWSAYVTGDTNSSIVVSEEGLNKIQAEVTDNSGNVSTITSGVYQIDKTKPSGVFTSNSATWRNTDITVSFNPSDDRSGVAQWRYRTAADGVTYGAWSSYIVGDTTSNIVIRSEGTNKIQAEVTDNAGNIITVTSGVYQIDKTLPSGLFTPNSATWGKTDLTITFNPSDDRSGVKQWRYKTSADGVTYGAWSAYIVGDTNSNITISAEGTNKIQVEVVDIAGNTSTIASGVYQMDKTLPSGVFNPNSATWTNTDVTVSFNPSDDRSGVKQWRYKTSPDGVTYGAWSAYIVGDTTSNIVISAEGLNKIQAEVTDKAGNVKVLTSGVYQIDKTTPGGVFTPNSATWRKTDLTVSFNPSDDRSGVKQWRYKQSSDGITYGAWSEYIVGDTTSNIVVSAEGKNRIQVEVVDLAGNLTTLTSGEYQIDKTLPSGVFSPNSASWRNTDITVSFNPSDDRSGVKQWRYKISSDNGFNYGFWSDYIIGDTTSSILISAEGNNRIQVEITDYAGNLTNLISGSYDIDKVLPSTTFNPNTSPWGNKDISVTISPDDDRSGVKQWRYRLSIDDGATWGAYSAYTVGKVAKTITISTEGYNKIQVETVDNAGNISVINSGTYHIDKTAPTGNVAFTYNDKTMALNMTLSSIVEKYSGIKTIYVQYKNGDNGILVGTQNFSASGLNYTRADNLYTIGNVNVYIIEVYATDIAGNTRLVGTKTIDTFKIEATLTKILDPADTVFKTGEMGIIAMKSYGAAEKIAITFDSKLTTTAEELKLNKTIIYTPIVIYDEPKYKFSVPMRAPIDTPAGNYTVKIEATRNGVIKTVFCNINVSDKSILQELKTIIVYPGNSSLNRGW